LPLQIVFIILDDILQEVVQPIFCKIYCVEFGGGIGGPTRLNVSATARQLILFISARLLLLSRVPVEKRPDETLRMDICPVLIENRHPSKPRPPGAENAGAIVGETHRSYKTVLRICLLTQVIEQLPPGQSPCNIAPPWPLRLKLVLFLSHFENSLALLR